MTSDPRASLVMVVEDDPAIAQMVSLQLELSGYRTQVERDGLAALDAIRRDRPDVILLDIGLPGLDGFSVARMLRSRPETSGARLIAVSGYGQEKDRARTAEAGFDLHLVKPVDPAKLTAAIEEA